MESSKVNPLCSNQLAKFGVQKPAQISRLTSRQT